MGDGGWIRGVVGVALFAAAAGVFPVGATPPPDGPASASAVAVRGVPAPPPPVEQAPTTTVALRWACPAGSVVAVVGDSITEQSAADLRRDLSGAGYTPWINARGGRTIVQGVEPVWGFGEEPGVTRCWVIALGTNDTWLTQPVDYLPNITALLSHVRAGEPVWWVPVQVAGGAAINTLVPVPLVAWHPVPVDMLPDGVHLTATGRQHWAATVLDAMTTLVRA